MYVLLLVADQIGPRSNRPQSNRPHVVYIKLNWNTDTCIWLCSFSLMLHACGSTWKNDTRNTDFGHYGTRNKQSIIFQYDMICQTKDCKNWYFCFSNKHVALVRKNKVGYLYFHLILDIWPIWLLVAKAHVPSVILSSWSAVLSGQIDIPYVYKPLAMMNFRECFKVVGIFWEFLVYEVVDLKAIFFLFVSMCNHVCQKILSTHFTP
jgi:hypothetical protein